MHTNYFPHLSFTVCFFFFFFYFVSFFLFTVFIDAYICSIDMQHEFKKHWCYCNRMSGCLLLLVQFGKQFIANLFWKTFFIQFWHWEKVQNKHSAWSRAFTIYWKDSKKQVLSGSLNIVVIKRFLFLCHFPIQGHGFYASKSEKPRSFASIQDIKTSIR